MKTNAEMQMKNLLIKYISVNKPNLFDKKRSIIKIIKIKMKKIIILAKFFRLWKEEIVTFLWKFQVKI